MKFVIENSVRALYILVKFLSQQIDIDYLP